MWYLFSIIFAIGLWVTSLTLTVKASSLTWWPFILILSSVYLVIMLILLGAPLREEWKKPKSERQHERDREFFRSINFVVAGVITIGTGIGGTVVYILERGTASTTGLWLMSSAGVALVALVLHVIILSLLPPKKITTE